MLGFANTRPLGCCEAAVSIKDRAVAHVVELAELLTPPLSGNEPPIN